jgi:hypothetical protein
MSTRPLFALMLVACGPVGTSRPHGGPDAPLQSPTDGSEVCYPGSARPCYAGDPALAGTGICKAGVQTCTGDGEAGTWGSCDGAIGPSPEVCNHLDDDCNGIADDIGGGTPCTIVDVTVNIDGDCVTASCPAATPYPVGCNIMMQGNDSRGCVAGTPLNSTVYFQEGDKCGVGHVSGTLQCATAPGSPLGPLNCAINKPTKFYPPTSAGCPHT